MKLQDLLYQCFLHFYHLDHSNAAIHTASVRYSPITFRLAEAINEVAEEVTPKVYGDVYSVLADKGYYDEDKGR